MMKKEHFPEILPDFPFGKYGLLNDVIDPFGSYTGIPADREKPVQDADDL